MLREERMKKIKFVHRIGEQSDGIVINDNILITKYSANCEKTCWGNVPNLVYLWNGVLLTDVKYISVVIFDVSIKWVGVMNSAGPSRTFWWGRKEGLRVGFTKGGLLEKLWWHWQLLWKIKQIIVFGIWALEMQIDFIIISEKCLLSYSILYFL